MVCNNENFEEMIKTLFLIQNKIYDNKYTDDTATRFKDLCSKKKLYFFGVGYYAKALPKYLNKKYDVTVDGQYDWFEKEDDEVNQRAFKLANMYYKIDEKKRAKVNSKIPLLTKEEFYKDPENTVIFLNYDNPIVEPYILFSLGFKNLYYLQTLAGEIMQNIMPPKKFDIYDRLDTMRTDFCFSDMDIAKISTVYYSLSDEKSKKVFFNLLKVKITSDVTYSQEVLDASTVHYFDKEVMSLGDEEVLIDCGANIGDTVESFYKCTNGKFKYIYAFEPDETNFNRMINYINTLDCKDKITPLKCGVGYKDETVYIINPGSTTTAITTTPTEFKIEVKTISSTIKHIPTLIKMDIEGYEICALLGAMDLIKTHKPKLAISIYHKFDDLWNIPALIKMWVPEYKISIRQYAFDRTETVLYATIN